MTQAQTEERSEKARQRAQIILSVRSGEITATEGATRLGISRKTYYQWEHRGLEGMLQALEEQQPGRPPEETDTLKDALEKENQELKRKLALAETSKAIMKRFHDLELARVRNSNREGKSKKKKKR
jgi:transposase